MREKQDSLLLLLTQAALETCIGKVSLMKRERKFFFEWQTNRLRCLCLYTYREKDKKCKETEFGMTVGM